MSSSDRQFQYVPRYKHFVKAPFIKRHRASSATHCYVLFAAKTCLVLPPIWSYLIPHPMLMRTAMRLILFHPRMALCWELWMDGSLATMVPRLPLCRIVGQHFLVALRYAENPISTSTYPRKTTRPYASYARITHLLLYAYRLYPPSLHQYLTYKRKASEKAGRIGFIFNSARCVNRPVSMINTAKIAITQQRMNQIKGYMLATSLTLPALATAMISK